MSPSVTSSVVLAGVDKDLNTAMMLAGCIRRPSFLLTVSRGAGRSQCACRELAW